jgi:uncharacterized membrane protein
LLRHWPRISSLLGVEQSEPRGSLIGALLQYWPAGASLLTVGVIYATLAGDLRVRPSFMVLALVVVLLVPILYTRQQGLRSLGRFLGLGLVFLATVAVASSVFRLVVLLDVEQTPQEALLNSVLVWITNGATFAVWYFEIDSGGPDRRRREGHKPDDFQFPQDQDSNSSWSPNFVDYLFLAFTTNLTFGPTDTAVLSTRAKILTMIQSFFSVLIIAVVVARATAQ